MKKTIILFLLGTLLFSASAFAETVGTFTGSLSDTDTMVTHQVILPSDGALTLDLVTDSTLAMSYYYSVRVYDENGTSELFISYGPDMATTDHLLYAPGAFKAGTYHIKLERSEGAGNYTLVADHEPNPLQNDTEPNDDTVGALNLALGASVTGHLGFIGGGLGTTVDYIDWYRVALLSDGVLTIDLLTDSTLAMSHYYSVRVKDADGTTDIFMDYGPDIDTTDNSFYTPDALKSGTYYIGLEGCKRHITL